MEATMSKNKIATELLGWLKVIAFAFIGALIVNHTLLASALVISSSMENTIMTDSRVMGLRVAYLVSDPKRFDIILFNPPDDDTSVPYVKRIIGLPNEKVEIIGGKVYIDDSAEPLDDSFIKETARGDYGPYYVPDGCYFVLGDNRNGSHDSRQWANKFVPMEDILGRLYFVYYPSPHFFS